MGGRSMRRDDPPPVSMPVTHPVRTTRAPRRLGRSELRADPGGPAGGCATLAAPAGEPRAARARSEGGADGPRSAPREARPPRARRPRTRARRPRGGLDPRAARPRRGRRARRAPGRVPRARAPRRPRRARGPGRRRRRPRRPRRVAALRRGGHAPPPRRRPGGRRHAGGPLPPRRPRERTILPCAPRRCGRSAPRRVAALDEVQRTNVGATSRPPASTTTCSSRALDGGLLSATASTASC
jgi:hypothetical protein